MGLARPENISIEWHITTEELIKRIKSLEKDAAKNVGISSGVGRIDGIKKDMKV